SLATGALRPWPLPSATPPTLEDRPMTKILAFAIAIAGIAAVSAPIQARLAANGTSLNGTSLNGTSLNGTSLNGTSPNGTSLNGTSLNGTSLNGTSLNGITTGTALNGQIIGIELPAGTGEAE